MAGKASPGLSRGIGSSKAFVEEWSKGWCQLPADPYPRRPTRTISAMAHPPRSDAATEDWVGDLRRPGPVGDAAVTRLHDLLLRITRSEVHRRSGQLRIAGPELDDIATQAADDAVVSVL